MKIILLFIFYLISAVCGKQPDETRISLAQSNALLMENTITSFLTLLTTGFVITSMIYLRLLTKGSGSQMIFCLFGCSFINQCVVLATAIIGQSNALIPNNTCKFFAGILQFTDVAQVFWVLAIAGQIASSYFFSNNFFRRNYSVIANASVWGISLILSIIPVRDYGRSDIWCTIKTPLWDFLTLYLFVGIVGVLIVGIYIAIIISIKRKNKNFKLRYIIKYDEKKDDAQACEVIPIMRRMSVYPILYLACWSVPFVSKVLILCGVSVVCSFQKIF